jgi:hypothetical protein
VVAQVLWHTYPEVPHNPVIVFPFGLFSHVLLLSRVRTFPAVLCSILCADTALHRNCWKHGLIPLRFVTHSFLTGTFLHRCPTTCPKDFATTMDSLDVSLASVTSIPLDSINLSPNPQSQLMHNPASPVALFRVLSGRYTGIGQ